MRRLLGAAFLAVAAGSREGRAAKALQGRNRESPNEGLPVPGQTAVCLQIACTRGTLAGSRRRAGSAWLLRL